MKVLDICEQFSTMQINEVAVNHFLSVYTKKHDVTAYFYYPNIKKLSIYVLSHDTYDHINVNKEYLLKVVYH